MKIRTFKIFTTTFGNGWDTHLQGKTRDIYVADWSDKDLEERTDTLMAVNPPIAIFPCGTTQRDLELKRGYAQKLVDALNGCQKALAEVKLTELA
jgi:hypothetical protein